MITVYYYSLITRKQEEMEFDYPEEVVNFINTAKNSILLTGISCVEDEDMQYINARI